MRKKWKTMQTTFFALGTVNTLMADYEDSVEEHVHSVFHLVQQRVEEMDDRFSVFKPDSEISQINEHAGKKSIQVSQETYVLIDRAVHFAEYSGGAFDITTRPVSKLWGIGKKGNFIPEPREIQKARKLVNYKDIYFESTSRSIGLKRKGQEMDLGGIAKGYAADEAKRILIEHGIVNAVINFGGTVIVLGNEQTIGIQNPREETGIPMGTLRVKDKAVVTSGSYERCFIKDGVCYHHLMDPLTGRPVDNDLVGITLVGESAMELDALSTAVFVLGIGAGNRLLQQMETEGIFIVKTGEVFMTSGLKSNFLFVPKEEICNG